MTTARCIHPLAYRQALTRDNEYEVVAHDEAKQQVRIKKDDRGRSRWYPQSCFDRWKKGPSIVSFTLDDPIADTGHDCVEVTVHLSDGQRRWCIFVTANWLVTAISGIVEPKPIGIDGRQLHQITWLDRSLAANDGTEFRMTNAPHMIVVSELSAAIVEEALRDIDGRGELERCTRPYES
jgi:hypothetical protein